MQRTFGAEVGMECLVPVEPDEVKCAGCGAESRHPAEIGGQFYCEDCTTCCDDCGDSILWDDALKSDDGIYYCESCYGERYVRCDDCGCEVSRDDAYNSDDGDSYCEDCYSDRFTRCEHCGDEVRQDRAHTSENGDSYCESCYCDLYNHCDSCGCEISSDETYCNDSGCYCESCYSSHSDTQWEPGYFGPANSTYQEIGSRRKFGVELETSRCDGHEDLDGDTCFGCKEDGSISGMEFVSPILYGDEGLGAIRQFCNRANRMGFEVDKGCGLHAHFDARDLSTEELKSVAYAYHKTADVWAAFVPDNRRSNHYCRPHTWGRDDLDKIVDSDDWRHFVNCGDASDRYHWVNLNAYGRHRTIEIRLHTATLDGDKVCNWVKAHTRFIDWAQNKSLAEIDEVFGCSRKGRTTQSKFNEIGKVWKDSALSDFYASRARQFGTNLGVLQTVRG